MYWCVGILISGVYAYNTCSSIRNAAKDALLNTLSAAIHCQYYCENCFVLVKPALMQFYKKIFNPTNDDIIIIKKKGSVKVHSVKLPHSKLDADMIIYGHNFTDLNNKKTVNMQRITKTDLLSKAFPPKYNLVNYKFYAITIRVLENNKIWASYPLSLSPTLNTIDNYFLKNNKLLDRTFVEYWLKHYHSIALTSNQTYDVHFLDNKFRNLTLGPDDYIILFENDYKIYSEDLNVA